MATKREYKGITQAHRDANARYDAENTVRITVKFNKRTDADILALLETVSNRQGYIKSVLRERLMVEQMTGFYYGMRCRGFSPGCQPKDGFRTREDDPTGKYYDILVYDRRLTEAEMRQYDLDELGK